MESQSDEWSFVASGLLACIAAVCVTYSVLRLWPRQHYPRLFAAMAGVAAVAAMYLNKIPGAGFALGAICIMFYISMHAPDMLSELFEHKDPLASPTQQAAQRLRPTGLGHIAFGFLVGVLLASALVLSFIMPPAYLRAWIMHPDALIERVRRGVDPTKEWSDLLSKQREAQLLVSKLANENADLSKRASEAEAELAKARDELAIASPNTVRGILINAKTGSRHAGGLIYIGVEFSVTSSDAGCYMIGSSDKTDIARKKLSPGEALRMATSKGAYRIVLVGVGERSCTFDLVKE